MPDLSNPKERLHAAFRTWDAGSEPLESIEARIHDGASIAHLRDRAAAYLDILGGMFPEAMPAKGEAIMEIGSGVGYILEEALRRYQPSRMVGLDVAAGMIAKAKERLARDGVDTSRVEFVHYDGVTAPIPDGTFDLIYSVASLQHAPRAYCFQALLEAQRLVKPGGHVCIHLIAYSHFKKHMTPFLFRHELSQQIQGAEGHWHHYYTMDELNSVLQHGMNAKEHEVREFDGSLYLTFTK